MSNTIELQQAKLSLDRIDRVIAMCEAGSSRLYRGELERMRRRRRRVQAHIENITTAMLRNEIIGTL